MENVQKERLFTSVKSRLAAALFGAILTATFMVAGMPGYLPFGQIDAIGVPIMLYPFIWTALFIYAFLAKSAWRVWGVIGGLGVLHIAVIYFQLT